MKAMSSIRFLILKTVYRIENFIRDFIFLLCHHSELIVFEFS